MSDPKWYVYSNGYKVEACFVTPLNLCATRIGPRHVVAEVLGITPGQWYDRLRATNWDPIFTETEARKLSEASGIDEQMFRPPRQQDLLDDPDENGLIWDK